MTIELTEKTTINKVIWNSQDLELLPDNGNIYEIIDGDLYMTRSPHWKHQTAIGRIHTELDNWSLKTGLGRAIITPGIIFSDTNNVIPDVVWISQDRLEKSLDEGGHLTTAPELIVEVLSTGKNDIKRDKEVKLKLYSAQGVKEYWLVDWVNKQVEIYRRNQAKLELVSTLFNHDQITSEILPQFGLNVKNIFI
jgi:Uma2 family endonuclease